MACDDRPRSAETGLRPTLIRPAGSGGLGRFARVVIRPARFDRTTIIGSPQSRTSQRSRPSACCGRLDTGQPSSEGVTGTSCGEFHPDFNQSRLVAVVDAAACCLAPARHPVTESSSWTWAMPAAIQAASITASCSAQVRTFPVRVTVVSLVVTATLLWSSTTA